MTQPSWRLLYESLIDLSKGPQYILANWNGPPSLLRRALAGKRLRKQLALHQQIALVKGGDAPLAAGDLAGRLQAAMDGAFGKSICRKPGTVVRRHGRGSLAGTPCPQRA